MACIRNIGQLFVLKYILLAAFIVTSAATSSTASSTITATESATTTSTASSTITATASSTITATESETITSTTSPTTSSAESPTTNATEPPSINVTSPRTTNAVESPSTTATSPRTTSITRSSTESPTTNPTETPSINVTSPRTTNPTETPSINVTSPRTINPTETPSINVTSPRTTNATETPSINVTSPRTTNATETSSINVTSPRTTNATETPSINVTSPRTTNATETPTATATETPITSSTESPTTTNKTLLTTTKTTPPTTTLTTQPTTTVTTQQETTTTVKTTTPVDETKRKPDWGAVHFKLIFSIEFTAEFTDELNNPESVLFLNYSKTMQTELTKVYKDTPGFLYIGVNGFRNGSVVVDYIVVLRAEDGKEDEVVEYIREKLIPHLENIKLNGFGVDPAWKDDMKKQLDNANNTLSDICKADNVCYISETCIKENDNTVWCISKCSLQENNCGDNGVCHVTAEGTPGCTCKTDDKYVYSGKKCEIESEKLLLKSGQIIGIAVGVGGAIILLLLIALVCMFRKMKRQEDDFSLLGVPKSERRFGSEWLGNGNGNNDYESSLAGGVDNKPEMTMHEREPSETTFNGKSTDISIRI